MARTAFERRFRIYGFAIAAALIASMSAATAENSAPPKYSGGVISAMELRYTAPQYESTPLERLRSMTLDCEETTAAIGVQFLHQFQDHMAAPEQYELLAVHEQTVVWANGDMCLMRKFTFAQKAQWEEKVAGIDAATWSILMLQPASVVDIPIIRAEFAFLQRIDLAQAKLRR